MSSAITILNVDDSDAARYARTRILERAGFAVIEAGTGADALRLVKEHNPALVLLDVRLPDSNGIEICRSLKSQPISERTPVVQISSTYVTERDQIAGLEGGAEVYLTEPVEPRELITVVRMLLRLRSAEKGLRDAELRWRRLFEANVVGIIVVRGTRVHEANDGFLHMLGLKREELATQRIDLRLLTHSDFRDVERHALAELHTEGAFSTFEAELVHGNGTRVRALIGGATLDAEADQWVALVLDITDRRRAEAEREDLLRREQAARREAERAAQLKDEFLANLSHELRTPMSTITGWLHLLRGKDLEQDQVQHGLQAIERATRSQNQLIEDLLDVSRIIAGKMSLEREPVDLRSILESSLEIVAFDAGAKNQEVAVDFAGGEGRVWADPRRLQQLFWNLFSNAVKFTPQGGRIEIHATWDAEKATVVVRDSGQGISPEFLPHVFDRFRQADGSSARRHGGMGLGLAIVRHVVDLHGGSVRAESEGTGKGATFTVELPRVAEDSAQRTVGELPRRTPDMPLRGVKVLLVEDDPDGREVAAAMLTQSGAECRTAANAPQALAQLDVWRPHVVVSDIGMSEIDGYEFVRLLRGRDAERGGTLPALALTAFAREEDERRALASGYDAHVVKPIDRDELVAKLRQVIARR